MLKTPKQNTSPSKHQPSRATGPPPGLYSSTNSSPLSSEAGWVDYYQGLALHLLGLWSALPADDPDTLKRRQPAEEITEQEWCAEQTLQFLRKHTDD